MIEEKKPVQFIPIAFEGRMTPEEKKMFFELRGTAPFNLLRKMIAENYALISMTLLNLHTDRELALAQGQLLGLSSMYNMIHTIGQPEEKNEEAIPLHRKILQNKV